VFATVLLLRCGIDKDRWIDGAGSQDLDREIERMTYKRSRAVLALAARRLRRLFAVPLAQAASHGLVVREDHRIHNRPEGRLNACRFKAGRRPSKLVCE
jgi:hypothetical protein